MNAKTFCQDMKVQLCNLFFICVIVNFLFEQFCLFSYSLHVMFPRYTLILTCLHSHSLFLLQPFPSFEWIIACILTLRFINLFIIIIIIFITTMYLFNNIEHNLLDFNLLLSNEPLIYISKIMAGWPVFKENGVNCQNHFILSICLFFQVQ